MSNQVQIKDGPALDAFSRLRVSDPVSMFDSQFTYNLNPQIFEQITAQAGASIAHNTTNRCAVMTFSSTPTGGKAYMQSYQYMRYQPGKSQSIRITFNFIEQKANCLKFVGYGDLNNGFFFENNGTTNRFVIYSGTDSGNQTFNQANWNIDKLDGTGPSGVTFDITKMQHVVIDFQALYVGRVRFGFNLNGRVYYVHESDAENTLSSSYIQTANLPIRCGMTCTGTVSTTMVFQCCAVISEGGFENTIGYVFSTSNNITAGNGTRTHLFSIRPKTTFNSLENRAHIKPRNFNLINTGNNPVKIELCFGQAFSVSPTYADANSTYSSVEVGTGGTVSGSPAIINEIGYVIATSQFKDSIHREIEAKNPITLNAAGANRDLGTMTVFVTGIGGTSTIYGAIDWEEVR